MHRHCYVITGKIGLQMGDVMRCPARIHHKMEAAFKTGNHQIIKDAACLVQEQRITHPSVFNEVHRGRGQALHHRVCASAGKFNLCHVRDIKKGGTGAAGKMLCFDASWILHRHIPTGKRHHAGAMGDMKVVKGSPTVFQFQSSVPHA